MASRTAQPHLLTLRIALWRTRRGLTVLVVLLLAVGFTRQLAPPGPRTEPVVVAARAVAAGHELGRSDLRVQAVPSRWVPDEAVSDPETLLSRRTAVPLPRGLPVVVSALEGQRFDVDPPPGAVVVALTVSAAAAGGMLRAGDVVDVVVPAAAPALESTAASSGQEPGGTAAVLARRALVLHVGTAHDESVMPDLLTPEASDVTAVVAVTSEEGRRLAAAATWGPLGTVLVP